MTTTIFEIEYKKSGGEWIVCERRTPVLVEEKIMTFAQSMLVTTRQFHEHKNTALFRCSVLSKGKDKYYID